MEVIVIIGILLAVFAINYYRYMPNRKNQKIEGDEIHESGMINKPRVIVLKGISNMTELQEEILLSDCDEETYGPYQLEIDGNNAKIILQDRVDFKNMVSLLTALYLDLDETHVDNPADCIKCYYPIAKISFGESVISNTDAVIYPVGNPNDLVVHVCTRDNKTYKYMEVAETMKELK